MNERVEKTFVSQGPEMTRALGGYLGRNARTAMLITLNGDLGCGKTTFTQGLAAGLGVPSEYPVTSPTYTLINEYPGRLRLFHVDLYRLPNGADLEDMGLYDILDSEQIVVIEWPDRIASEDLPESRIDMRFTATDDRRRKIVLTAYGLEAEDLLNEMDIPSLERPVDSDPHPQA